MIVRAGGSFFARTQGLARAGREVRAASASFLTPESAVFTDRQIYMDYKSTTPVDPRVARLMHEVSLREFGNYHSRTHSYGWRAEKLVEDARAQIAQLVNAKPSEIVFTSGATESNNLALKGFAEFAERSGDKRHIVSVQTEHKSVLGVLNYLKHARGWKVTYLPVDKAGRIDLEELRRAITAETALVSVMMVNNEIGTIQPIAEVCRLARAAGVAVHVDAAQALGKVPIDVEALGVDLMSFSAHKVYGPKGVGALYVRAKPRVRLAPQMHGGGQERGLRSGTLPVPLCVGFGEACRLSREEFARDLAHVRRLSERFVRNITSRLPAVRLNGGEANRYPGCCNLAFTGVEGESLIMGMKEIAVSSGSACTSASLEPSYVLRALGVDEELAHTSIRFSFGRFTTLAEVDRAADLVVETVSKLRSISPLWDAHLSNSKPQTVWK